MRKLLLAGLIGCVCTTANAVDLGLELNTDAAKIYASNVYEDLIKYEGAVHYSSDDGKIINLGAKMIHDTGYGDVGLGGKYVALFPEGDSDTEHLFALGVDYKFPIAVNPKFLLYSGLYYAPDILTGGAIDNYIELDAHVAYKMMPQAEVQLGYKYLKFEDEYGNDYDFDQNIYLGLKFQF